ncbi:MAG: mannose-1-phosphate guanylyltransferase/mannose-6-phosphate isomerase [Sphingomonadaceae bacterium]
MTKPTHITPVILSGGSGTRLWPLSRPEQPKQFLPLTAEATMFALTVARAADRARFADPIIVAGAQHQSLIERQLNGQAATLILEPSARNTAPAIALAALATSGAMLVMPSDHVIDDVPAFHAAIDAALPLVAEGWLVTFGIGPTGPETGYGYIETGDVIAPGVHRVARFVEKPARDAAQAMLATGTYFWNGGIFLFSAEAYLTALADNAPDMLASATSAMKAAVRAGNVIHPDKAAFDASPADSIDYAVMERADRVAVVPVNMGWSDIGSWDALYDLGHKDAHANLLGGDVIALQAQGNLIRSDGLRISVSGVSDLIIIASGNDVMIVPRGQSQAVKTLVAERR